MFKKIILKHRNFNNSCNDPKGSIPGVWALASPYPARSNMLSSIPGVGALAPIILIFCLQFLVLSLNSVFANNLSIANVKLVDKDTKNGTYDIKFDISWENSWFISGAPSPTANWDSAWVFVKYSTYSSGTWSAWKHVSLLNTGYVAPTGSQTSFGDTNGVYKGVFIYRSGAGNGTNNFNNTEIRWNYKADGVSDKDIVQVQVFGIEMVYIPTGNFSVGDDTARTVAAGGTESHFFDAGDSTDPRSSVLITSTQPYISNVNDGSGTAGDITWNNQLLAGSLPGTRTQLNSNYPTGYKAFYLMKYEMSQRQYADFLNNLTSTQAANRTGNLFAANSYSIKLASNGKYGSDANNNAGTWGTANYNLMNEIDDGEWWASPNMSWPDFCAYADWSGLRPVTELEHEKACRGPNTPVSGEYAWGNTTFTQASGTSNWRTANETYSTGNAHYLGGGSGGFDYWMRCGAIAGGPNGGTRAGAGAGYYGCLELSGNLNELRVSVMGVGTSVSNFAGTPGDGILSTNGNATNSDWHGFANGEVTDNLNIGVGVRGGGNGIGDVTYLAVSHRGWATYSNYGIEVARSTAVSGRFARTAP